MTSGGGTWNKTYRLYLDSSSPYTVGGGTLVSTITGVTVGAPQKTFNNLVEGYYYVTVTDANGCTESTPIQSTFIDIGDPIDDKSCNCIEVSVPSSYLRNAFNQDLYYINNDCEAGETSVNLNSQLSQGNEDVSIFYFCSKPTLSNMFRYGPSGDSFISEFSDISSNGKPCNNNFDCM